MELNCLSQGLEIMFWKANVIIGSNARYKVFIPIMTLTPLDSMLPLKFQRKQYTLIVSYAMTINKSRGKSLSHVELYLRILAFSYGQFYKKSP